MTLQTFAQQHRLKISRDECNDEVIKGRRGHLHFDGPELCLMILDGPLRARSVLKAIGGKLWTGDKSAGELHLYRGAPAVRCWSKYQQTDKGISLCSAPLRKDSKGRSVATEDPTVSGGIRGSQNWRRVRVPALAASASAHTSAAAAGTAGHYESGFLPCRAHVNT